MTNWNEFSVDPSYIEKCIIKSMLTYQPYCILISEKFEPNYFSADEASITFKYLKKHLNEFKSIPSQEIILNSISNKDDLESVTSFFDEINSIDFDTNKEYEWLYENTNLYLKDKALKDAIMQSVNIIENKSNIFEIRNIIESALCRDLKVDLGLNYFDDLNTRIARIFNATDIKVPCYFPMIDELINGGLPAYTLSVWAAVTHGGKSLLMANMISRQILKGHTGVLFTMEMSEDAFAQRFDSIYSGLDINKMYIKQDLKQKLIGSLKETKGTDGRGDLYIKEFPTGSASVNHLRIYLRELSLRGIHPDIIYCDYINLMAPSSKSNKNKYEDVTQIVRELRALSLEFKAPVVSVTQINREGSFLNLKELNWNYIAECISIASDSDFVGILGHDPDKLNYESEIHYKIVKNRLGGRIGTIGKLYMDSRSLKLYDENEYEMWLEDAKRSGDDRNVYTGE